MAKRAPILPENYNPVGERLKRVVQLPPAVVPEPLVETPRIVGMSQPHSLLKPHPPSSALVERRPIPETPVDRELKTASMKIRCTLSERKKWHEITRELSGDHNNLSHFVRAAMLLIENSYDPLRKLAPDIQRFQKPPTNDTLAITLYEQRLAQYLYDALKQAGRPKG
jgi:hypothetical protein